MPLNINDEDMEIASPVLLERRNYSAMASSAGVTCGIATQFVLDKHPAFSTPGIHAPYHRDVYDSLREALDCDGFALVERVL